VVADPAERGRIFGWRVTSSQDPLGNLIRYEYLRDQGESRSHRWDQPLLSRISYADYGDRADPSFLVAVEFDYEPRPDPFSDHRAGFEIRTSLRCRTIRVVTHAADGVARTSRENRFTYTQAGFTGASLLTRVDVVGIDESGAAPLTENLPPLTFEYSGFDSVDRRFEPLTGPGLPTAPLGDPRLALVDLRGIGLPDIVELGVAPRFWRNAGGGRFELPRRLTEAPPFTLGQPGVTFADADGDGRPDLVVSATAMGGRGGGPGGYFPMTFGAGWDRRSFRPYRQSPAVDLNDPAVKLVDLDGDGLTDVLASRGRLTGFFDDADPHRAWRRAAPGRGIGPDIDLADPRVHLADMTGDGLSDIVVIRSGDITYWPNLGHNRWGPRVAMTHSPRFPDGFDPRLVLLGDLDGDGTADLVFVGDGRVLVWGNQSGNAWSPHPVVVTGTPAVVDTATIRLADLHGTGMAGLLFSGVTDGPRRARFLDVTGGVKPHLLTTMDNHLGARTTVSYRPSIVDFLRDAATPATRWRTTLPFPVQVVGRVEVADAISGGRLTTEYRYHHGYWDGVEREFRGFAMVEQFDTETFDTASSDTLATAAVPEEHFSPPTLTRSWFHPGPVAAVAAGDWTELDLSGEYWAGDAPMLSRPAVLTAFLSGLSRTDRRTALRTMRGQMLRTELYALDGGPLETLPYTVTESLPGVREESPPPPDARRERIFFPFQLGTRTTRWERGTEPMTQFTFPAGFDAYGLSTGEIAVAVPRGRDPRVANPVTASPYLATYLTIEYAQRDETGHYLVSRTSRTSGYEVVNDGRPAVADLVAAVLAGPPAGGGFSLHLVGHARTYYDGDAFTGLPLGTLGEHGLAVWTETLAFTDDFLDSVYDLADPHAITPRPVYLDPGGVSEWPAEYPADFQKLAVPLAGYQHYTEDAVPGSPGGYYIVAARHRFDVHDPARVPRGLPIESLDPLGARSLIDYDEHDLLPVRSTDPVGLTVTATNDYRLLQPRATVDVNGNVASVTFSPAGLVTAHFVSGKDGTGDSTRPSVRISYDMLAFAERGEPASARVERRTHHDTDPSVPPEVPADVLVAVQFSDGFGRTLQTRAQAEDVLFGDPAFGGGVIDATDLSTPGDTTGRTRGPGDPDNVVVSGWQVYDNKGRVVQKYEPFFATGYDYGQPGDTQLGQRTTMFYDARGQLVETRDPDGSQQRTITGIPVDLADPDVFTPTPWEAYSYDENDNAGRTHGAAAQGFASHWNTPSSVEIDALGRVVRSVVRNGPPEQAAATWFTTRSTYDIQDNLVATSDTLGRATFRYTFDLVKRRWRVDTMDAGRRDSVLDVLGNPVERRDSKGALALGSYDLLHRPSRTWARDDTGGPVTLRERIDYGDAGLPAQAPADRAAARAVNALGRPVRQHDEAGLVSIAAYDLKGNVLATSRQVISDNTLAAALLQAATEHWHIKPFQVDWTPLAAQTQDEHDNALLERVAYTTTSTFDALNRITTHTFPADVNGERQVLRPIYNRAGTLSAVNLGNSTYVQRIAYDAKGQRALIAYGNGIMTRYAYDPHVFRLTRLRSEPYTSVDRVTYHPSGPVTQDYGYVYDLVGNIHTVRDRTPGSGIPANPDALDILDPVLRKLVGGGNALDRRFGYDPIYRLLTATGREQSSPPAGDPWIDVPRGVDVKLAQAYAETYAYDAADNLASLAHSGNGGFTRVFITATDSNRLKRLTVAKTPYDYTYDASGNLTGETLSRHLAWNHADQLKVFATQTPDAEPSVFVQYLYDAAGERVKKFVRRQGGRVEVTHYLSQVFEHHRWAGSAAGENNHIHVMDDSRRVALVRLGPAHPDDKGPATAFHLGDHLGSSSVVVDSVGSVTNREEYTPYGETSFGSYTRKRFRFTGKERDEESGLAYHGARYYQPWLGRWTSCDPKAPQSGLNVYAYGKRNPLRFTDPTGTEDKQVTELAKALQSVADNLESALRRNPGESPSAFGTRLHDIFQGIIESAAFNFPGLDTSRVLTEVVVDASGKIVKFAGKPGGSPSGAVTADIVILKKGIKNTDRLVGRKAADVFEIGIDFKTGRARVQTNQKEFFGSIKATLAKLKSGGGLPEDLAKSPRSPGRSGSGPAPRGAMRGATTLEFMGTLASIGLIALMLAKDFSAENALAIAKAAAGQAALDATAVLLIGRSISGPLIFFGGMRSDSAKFSAEQEARELQEAGEKEISGRAWDYMDDKPDVTYEQARRHVIDSILAHQKK
jgi:RHS repeat-associated protein